MVKRPRLPTAVHLGESMVFIPIDYEGYSFGCPFDGIGMPLWQSHIDDFADLCALRVIVGLSVDSAMDMPRVKADMFHDVNLTAFGPLAISALSRQHPNGWPSSPS